MNFEAEKLQLDITDKKISISDRMTIKHVPVLVSLLITSILAVVFLGLLLGVIFALVFSIGYFLFRYLAWFIWKRIEIDLGNGRLTISHMLLNSKRRTDLLTNKFIVSDLKLKEFEQSGMQRAMLQYQDHKLHDLLLLTHPKDIELIKREVFSSEKGSK